VAGPDLRETARAFVAAAFVALREEHVIPTPIYHPFVAVGRDYFGDTIRAVPAYHDLERQLNEAYPERFAGPVPRPHAEFADSYVFGFLEACVARCGSVGDFDPESPGVSESIDELVAVLETRSNEIVCCRHVSHLTTAGGEEVEIGDVTVVPEPEGPQGWGLLVRRIQREVRGAARAWNRDDPRPHAPPHSLLIAREVGEDPEPYKVAERLAARVDRFLLVARLLTAGTVQSVYEIAGATTLVARMYPVMHTFRSAWFGGLVRRTVRLSGEEGAAFAALSGLIDAAEVKREGMAATSFDVALSKFNRSHIEDSPYEHLVDLATALEAALIGDERETEGVTLRLRSRVAALLATEDDPAEALFADVGRLYWLRSKLVHGGQIPEKELRKAIRSVSTVAADEVSDYQFGVALGHAVDRMRDLVRRAILARLCLAAGPDALWPFAGGDISVDGKLADDAARALWRSRWHDRLEELGVGQAGSPPTPAVDALSQEDR
jgi:Apea-like HEPN